MLGMDYVLPVRPVERYVADMDSQMVPKAVIPGQETEPWVSALTELLTDRARYDQLSTEGHRRAARHLESVTIKPFEGYLLERLENRKPDEGSAEKRPDSLEGLSAEKRALLLRKLRERKGV